MNEIELLLKKIRDYVNRHHPHKVYKKEELYKWDELCIAMDILDDTTLAILEYLENGRGNTYQEIYLRLYGMLQAVFTQQDALVMLCSAFNIRIHFRSNSSYKSSAIIRDFRNLTIGHPTDQGKKEKNRSYFGRMTLTKKEVTVVTYINKGTERDISIRKFNIDEMLNSYLKELHLILTWVIQKQPLWYEKKLAKNDNHKKNF